MLSIASHQYVDPGDYTVTLTATNAAGSDVLIETDYISVPEPAGLAQLLSGVYGLFLLSAYRKRD